MLQEYKVKQKIKALGLERGDVFTRSASGDFVRKYKIGGSISIPEFILRDHPEYFESMKPEAQIRFDVILQLFGFLEAKIDFSEDGSVLNCGGEFRLSKGFLSSYLCEEEIERAISFFVDNGGHCDCEVLVNVRSRILSIVEKGLDIQNA